MRSFVIIKGAEFTRKDFNRFVDDAASLGEISKWIHEEVKNRAMNGDVSVHRYSITRALEVLGLHRKWKKNRRIVVSRRNEEKERLKKAPKRLKEKRRNLIHLINLEIAKKLAGLEFSERKTAEYYLRRPSGGNRYSISTLLEFYKNYKKRQISGEKKSFAQQAIDVGLKHATNAREIAVTVGLESDYFTASTMKRFTPEEEERLCSLANSPLSSFDIAYFIGCNGNTVKRKFRSYNIRDRHIREIKKIGYNESISYRKASQVYELVDAGFTEIEILEHLGISIRFFDDVISNRPQYEKPIIEALRILFPEEDITVPYR